MSSLLEMVLLSVPLWLKLSYTGLIMVLIPVYLKHYGPKNFLWFSDIALFTIAMALWLESPLLASMMGVGVLLPEIAWNIDYFGRLMTGKKLFGLSNYMFDANKPLFLRALSLFHMVLPATIIYLLAEFGYQPRAINYQILMTLIVLPLSYFLTDKKENTNWVFGPGSKPQKKLHPLIYLIIIMIAFPVLIHLPTHLLLMWIFG
jgi:hypothetical protein